MFLIKWGTISYGPVCSMSQTFFYDPGKRVKGFWKAIFFSLQIDLNRIPWLVVLNLGDCTEKRLQWKNKLIFRPKVWFYTQMMVSFGMVQNWLITHLFPNLLDRGFGCYCRNATYSMLHIATPSLVATMFGDCLEVWHFFFQKANQYMHLWSNFVHLLTHAKVRVKLEYIWKIFIKWEGSK